MAKEKQPKREFECPTCATQQLHGVTAEFTELLKLGISSSLAETASLFASTAFMFVMQLGDGIDYPYLREAAGIVLAGFEFAYEAATGGQSFDAEFQKILLSLALDYEEIMKRRNEEEQND